VSRGRPALDALAAWAGVLPGYTDAAGRPRRVAADTRVALLDALGFEAASERAARDALATAREARARRLLPPVLTVLTRNRARVWLPRRPRAAWRLDVWEEGGAHHVREGRAGRGRPGVPPLPWGYHRVALEAGGERAEAAIIVAPPACPDPRRVLRHPGFGLAVNLYTVTSESNWGVGDLGDLGALAEWARDHGAGFLSINPLHALANTGERVSPYAPLSRLFRNPLYLDLTAIPEAADLGPPGDELRRLRAGGRIPYDAVLAAKRTALERAFDRFRQAGGARAAAFAAFRRAHGAALENFGVFVALGEQHQPGGSPDWRGWPEPFRDPASPAVAAFRAQQARAVELQAWIQFELDRQLAAAAGRARGMACGLMGDLAVGTTPDGADVWAARGVFARGVHLGAPPDPYARAGQEWGLTPFDPLALAADGFAPWRAVLRSALAHMGALRLDHAMGLVRQYWVPAGADARDGGYVAFPTAGLLAVLALEATRAGALIVGEDLGTVPRGFTSLLARRRILSTRVLYFERDRDGAFRPARRYSRRALVAVHTHDQVPLAGFWAGRDVELRRAVGLLPGDRALAAARRARARDRRQLLQRLISDGVLPRTAELPSPAALCAAVHSLLARTPAPLVAASLDDLTGEREPVNVPGVGMDRHPSWTRRAAQSRERLVRDPLVRAALGELPRRRGSRP
jgi:4-alpha-glucanotransferase